MGEVLDFVARHYPEPLPLAEITARFGLTELTRRQTGGLSGGQQRRLAVALAFVGRPRLVILDEPTTGLDVEARHILWDAITEFHADGGTVVLTSHYLEEIEALAQRVVVIGNGRVLADGSVGDVRGRLASSTVTLRAAQLPPLAGVVAHRVVADRVVADRDDGSRRGHGGRHELQTADADELVRELVLSGVEFRGLEVRPASLEEAFLALTASPTVGAHR